MNKRLLEFTCIWRIGAGGNVSSQAPHYFSLLKRKREIAAKLKSTLFWLLKFYFLPAMSAWYAVVQSSHEHPAWSCHSRR